MRGSLISLIWVILTGTAAAGDRVVVHLDFEEAQIRPLDLPLAFEEIADTQTDFPRFGDMSLSEETAHQGRFSFRFDLNGRSMAARTLTGTIPVLPRVDHRVEVMVQTRDLQYAAVRMVAWLMDEHQEECPGTRVTSETLTESPDSFGRWRSLDVVVPGHDPAATELIVELQLVQIRGPAGTISPDFASRPDREGISGSAFFDDLVVTRHPRLFFADASRIGLHPPGASRFHLRIDDPGNDDTNWDVVVTDSRGQTVHHAAGTVPADGLDQALDVPLTQPGWYRAETTVRDRNGRLIGDALAFAILQPDLLPHPEPRLRVNAAGVNVRSDDLALSADLLGHLGVGEAVVPTWFAEEAFMTSWPAVRDHGDELFRQNIVPIFALTEVPADQVPGAATSTSEVVSFVADQPACLDSVVDAAIIAFGDRAARWRLGRMDHDPALLETAHRALLQRLGGLVVRPQVDLGPPRTPRRHPPSIHGEVYETTTRVLEAWCQGDPTIEVDMPWQANRHGLEPTPHYPALGNIIRAVRGRPRVTWISSPPDLRVGMLEGDGRDPIVVAWQTVFTPGSSRSLTLPLMGSDLHATSLMGGAVRFNRGMDDTTFEIGDVPVVIRGFDPEPVQALAHLHLEPARLEAALRVHDHTLSLTNASSRPWQGQLIARGGDHIRFRPGIIGVDLRPGATLQRPVEIVVTGPLPAQTLPLHWDLRLHDGRRIPLITWMPAGLDELEVFWSRRRNARTSDLVIDVEFVNQGNDPRRLDARLGHPDLEMPVTTTLEIEPGEKTTQTFRIPAGSITLAGESVALIVEEVGGPGRIRNYLVVPPGPATARARVSTVPADR